MVTPIPRCLVLIARGMSHGQLRSTDRKRDTCLGSLERAVPSDALLHPQTIFPLALESRMTTQFADSESVKLSVTSPMSCKRNYFHSTSYLRLSVELAITLAWVTRRQQSVIILSTATIP